MLGSFVRPALLYKNEPKVCSKRELISAPKEAVNISPPPAPSYAIPEADPDDVLEGSAYLGLSIVFSDSPAIKIELTKKEAEILTCGWLLSEAIRRLSEQGHSDPRTIVYLQTVERNFALDFWLTQLDRSLEPFVGNVFLEPFFAERCFTQVSAIENYSILRKIGDGASADVYLTRKKSNGRFFAIKAFLKAKLTNRSQREKVLNEKEIMKSLDYKYLVSLKESFQNDKFLFLAMEYCPGGELFFHLRNRGKFTEAEAAFYFREVVQCLDYLHQQNIVFRDLKPENVLLDIDGHVRLVDLGISKKLKPNERTSSFCGSIDYIPPEMLKKKPHGLPADIYSLGVFLYELIAGYPPFSSKSPKTTLELIEKQKLTFPSYFSKDLTDLLKKLMKKEPVQRLGAKEGCKKILEHPWCSRFCSDAPPIKLDFKKDYHFPLEVELGSNLQASFRGDDKYSDFPNFYFKKPSPNYQSMEDLVIREEFIKEPRNTRLLHSVSAHLGDFESLNSEIFSCFERPEPEKEEREAGKHQSQPQNDRPETAKLPGKNVSMLGRVLQAFRKSNSFKK